MDSGRELVAFNGGEPGAFRKARGGTKDDPARGGLEHAVDDHAVEVQVGVECGASYRPLALNAPPIDRG